MSADSGPGNREVAHRIFAAEFDDATLSYSESDEERAPNFVVTPTGARVNRLFAVGVLTEVESVNDETLRGRVVDPTGAFVTYAGQYQPDEQSFLGRTTPPAFVAMAGKARTFEPEDSDMVYTSVRPESLSEVDADTRDRWTVSAAENTLHRIAVFAAALESGLTGDQLRAALEAAGVDDTLAAGIPKAIEHYGTTEGYLEAVRSLAVEALEQVGGDRSSVGSLDVAPHERGPADLGPLPDVDLDLTVPDGMAVEADAPEDAVDAADDAGLAADADDLGSFDDDVDETPSVDDEPASVPDDESAEPVADTDEPADAVSADPESDSATADETETEAPDAEAADAVDAPADAGEPGAADSPDTEPAGDDSSARTVAAEASEPAAEADSATDEPAEIPAAAAEDDLGDADSDLGDFDAGDDFGGSTADEPTADDEDDEDDDLGDFDVEEDDALTEEERQEVEAEFGTDFSTGSEVGSPGEAGIDVPSSEEELEELEAETDAEPADTEPAGGEPAVDPEPEPAAAETSEPEETEPAADADDEPAEDVDIDAAVLDAMSDLDDGDGAEREKVVAAVVSDTGADPGAVKDAIQDALMSGQCYEPADGMLKAI